MENSVKQLSDLLALKSAKEAECFPVDRYFLEKYIDQILLLNRNDFIIYNFESINNTYSVQLMLCLPEIWEDIFYDDILFILNQFTNVFSYYAIIEFMYKYIEINIIDIVMQSKFVSRQIKKDIINYLSKSFYPNLQKSETDYLFFEEGVYGVSLAKWSYIKQKLLIDPRIEPALKTIEEIKDYVSQLEVVFKN